MIRRVERQTGDALKRPALTRPRRWAAPNPDAPAIELALGYSNGYVTVEISQEALEAFVDHNGDVPLPIAHDAETGDRHVFDARNNVRVVYDAESKLREVATRSSDGLFVRINFTDAADLRPAGP
jgi:hypothetical protein